MTFLYPQMFLFLFIPTVILFYFMITAKPKILRIFSEEVYEKLSLADRAAMGRTTRMSLLFIALLLMITAFSRPVIDRGNKEVVAKGVELVIGLDISKSMDTTDIYPSRLEASIQKIRQLLEQVKGDKLAVVAFAKDSYIISPMTKDTKVVRYLLDTLDLNRFEDRSSNMPAAIEAADILATSESRSLLMLSDGDEGDMAEIKESAKEHGITIYAIGMAKEKGSPVNDGKGGYLNDPEGNIVISALNPALKELALSSGGAYTDFTVSGSDILALYRQIRHDQKAVAYDKETIRDLTELFYYPLGLAIFFLLVAFHSLPSRSAAAVMLLISLGTEAHSASFDFDAMRSAQQHYRSGEYQKALQDYARIGGLDHDSEAARLHNMGNAHFRLKEYDRAIESYEASLKLDQNEDTRHNLDMAKKAKKEQQQQQQNENRNQDQQKKEDQQQEQQDQQQQKQQEKQSQQDQKEKDSQNKEQAKPSEQKDAKAEEPKEAKAMESKEEARLMRQLEQKPNPIPLKKLPVTQGGSSAKYW